jgi:branched-chain amino acid aminotransferase
VDAHLARLAAGAGIIDLRLPSGLDEALRELVAANGWREAVVRLTVTRGVAPGRRGLLPDPDLPPTVLITGRSLVEAPPYPNAWYAAGIDLATGGPRRNEHSPLSRCKTLQYLDQVLLRQAAARRGAEEGLQQNTAGAVAGASVANLFLVRAGRVQTPDLDSGCLPGITRALVLALARERGWAASEEPLSLADVQAADEVFLTNTLMEVLPVSRMDGAAIGAGRPGPVTLALAAAFGELHEAAE